MPAKPSATRSARCVICRWPCHATSLSCRKCELMLVAEAEAFLADVRPSADGGAA